MRPIEKITERLRASGRELKPEGSWLKTRCPAHDDSTPSLGIKEDAATGKAVVRCFGGCSDETVLKSMGLQVRDLFPERVASMGSASCKKLDGVLTLDQLATAKKLPMDFLQGLGLVDYKGGVVIPYYLEDGKPARVRLRMALTGENRFRWGKKKNTEDIDLKTVPYGLWRLSQARTNGNLILVEGESDCWSGWYHNLNVLGLPGAETARLLQAEHLAGIKRVCVVEEPDQGGSNFVANIAARLTEIGFGGTATTFQIGSDIKDLSDLHIKAAETPNAFAEIIRACFEHAQPLVEPVKVVAPQEQKTTGVVAPASHVQLRNHEVFTYADKNGDLREGIKALPIKTISRSLLAATANWPRRVESLLFTDENGTIRYLEDRDSAFAWLQERMPIFWAAGGDTNDQTLVTKAEFCAHLQAATQNYVAVEELPHEPNMTNHYYAWRMPVDYKPTGEYLSKLAAFFDNAQTPQDKTLIKAALLTPGWGGMEGKRPAFVIMAPDRGCGKSTLANAIGHLYGGHIELQLTKTAEDKLTSRLLTPSALSKRVVRIDNIKEHFASAFVEGLITSPVISGHRLYYGEAARPNTLTFVLTGNSLRLSRDIAERAFIIRLTKPVYRPEWESEVMNFITAHRARILADALHLLRGPQYGFSCTDRYADWVKGVLSRCDDAIDAVVAQNLERRGICDEDVDEASLIMNKVDEHADSVAAANNSVFVDASKMTDLVNDALHEHLSSKAVNARMRAHMEAGRLDRVKIKRTNKCNGYDVHRLLME